MTESHHNVDHTREAVERLRAVVQAHHRSGDEDTPFFIGIREALDDLDAYRGREEQSAA